MAPRAYWKGYLKEARFPSVKSLDSFDFAAIPSLNKTLVLELARSGWKPALPMCPEECFDSRNSCDH